jgi:hypothetical protein
MPASTTVSIVTPARASVTEKEERQEKRNEPVTVVGLVNGNGSSRCRTGPVVVERVMAVMVVLFVAVVMVVVVVVAVDRRPGDLVADEEDHGLEEIAKPAARRLPRLQSSRQTSEHCQKDRREHDLENHVFRNAEARFHRIQAVERRERLRDENFSVHRRVKRPDIGNVGAAIPQELRHVVEGPPPLAPHRLGDFKEVTVLEVVDRVVVGHGSKRLRKGLRALFQEPVARVCGTPPMPSIRDCDVPRTGRFLRPHDVQDDVGCKEEQVETSKESVGSRLPKSVALGLQPCQCGQRDREPQKHGGKAGCDGGRGVATRQPWDHPSHSRPRATDDRREGNRAMK